MISTSRTGNVLVATLSRPPVNALNSEMAEQLEQLLDKAEADAGVSVLRFRSDQKVFCAGGDMVMFEANFGTPEGREILIEKVTIRLQRLFTRIEAAPFVTLAEIQGHALGGGLELAMACDLRVAAVEAKLGLTEVQLGLLAAAGGTQRLTRLCGVGVAKRMILGAEMVTGDEAQRLGIVQWSMPRSQVEEFTDALTLRYASMPRASSAESKSCIAAAMDPSRDGFAEEIASSRRLYINPETRAKVAEFTSRSKR